MALPKRGTPLEIGKGRGLREGSAVALLSFGARLPECLTAADQLAGFGLSTTVADARFAKPLDMDLRRRLAAGFDHCQIARQCLQRRLEEFGRRVVGPQDQLSAFRPRLR